MHIFQKLNRELIMNYSFMDLTEKKYPVSKLGTKPKLMSKTLDKTDLHPVLADMYSHARELNRAMSKYDRENTGKMLYNTVIEAYSHFSLSYYHITMDDVKLSESYELLSCLEKIKFLTDQCFSLNLLHLDQKHIEGLRNKIYITIASIQEQSEKWYQWINSQVLLSHQKISK